MFLESYHLPPPSTATKKLQFKSIALPGVLQQSPFGLPSPQLILHWGKKQTHKVDHVTGLCETAQDKVQVLYQGLIAVSKRYCGFKWEHIY